MKVDGRSVNGRIRFNGREITELRKGRGLTQHQFWDAIGITQSLGSLYERGHTVPRTVQLLIDLVHRPEGVEQLQAIRARLARIEEGDGEEDGSKEPSNKRSDPPA